MYSGSAHVQQEMVELHVVERAGQAGCPRSAGLWDCSWAAARQPAAGHLLLGWAWTGVTATVRATEGYCCWEGCCYCYC